MNMNSEFIKNAPEKNHLKPEIIYQKLVFFNIFNEISVSSARLHILSWI